MKRFYHYLKDYIQDHFNWKLYLATFLFASTILSLNFYFDFEDTTIDSYYGSYLRIFWYILFHGIPYYIVCLFIVAFTKNKSFIKNKGFWIVSLIGFVILGIHRGNFIAQQITSYIEPSINSFIFTYRIINRWVPLITVILPLTLFYFFYLRKQYSHFYGIRRKNVYIAPYFLLLAMMLPLIIIASFQPDFLTVYPNYLKSQGPLFAADNQIPERVVVVMHEISYSFAFFIVEIFFRGFLIYALVKYLGKDVVLPMAVTYCVLHFGKPLGEAISSIFGGYILGILSYRTQNIYGGIIVHIGIALLMELFAFLQIYLN